MLDVAPDLQAVHVVSPLSRTFCGRSRIIAQKTGFVNNGKIEKILFSVERAGGLFRRHAAQGQKGGVTAWSRPLLLFSGLLDRQGEGKVKPLAVIEDKNEARRV
ncbi:MAG: hypothetical protein IKV35_01225, partial [Clostridia bacterium]|nr:hypothetical protein [Clostridia bacterium]